MPAIPPVVLDSKRALEVTESQNVSNVELSLRGIETKKNDPLGVQYVQPPSGSWWNYLKWFGPGWLVSIAYVDPGNYQAQLASGSTTGYTQNWVVIWTTLLSLYICHMCVKLQHYTNTNLAQAMAGQYPRYVRYLFWFIAEFTVVITDLPEVIGFAVAINLINPNVPLWAGVILSLLTTFAFLMTLSRGTFVVEVICCALVLIMSIVLFVEWDMSPTNSTLFLKGAFLPLLPMDPSAIYSVIGIIGAVVMPHNLYLQSGTLASKRVPSNKACKKKVVLLGTLDPVLPLLITIVVQWSIAVLAAIYVYEKPDIDVDQLGIASFPQYLDVKGGTVLWAVALIAAAQSSCITTTYSGQFVMDGFLNVRLPLWLRAVLTRVFAIIPCILVAAFAGTRLMEQMIDAVNAALSFMLPFALIPLVKLTTSKTVMGDFVAGKIETCIIWAATLVCFGVNVFVLVAPEGGFFGNYTGMMTIVGVQMNILQDFVFLFYVATCAYMTFKPVVGKPLPMTDGDGCGGLCEEVERDAQEAEKQLVQMANVETGESSPCGTGACH